MSKKIKVDCFMVSYEGEYSTKKISKELLEHNPVTYRDKKFILFNLDNTGTAGTNTYVIHLLVETRDK
jgi:hypothetical protein